MGMHGLHLVIEKRFGEPLAPFLYHMRKILCIVPLKICITWVFSKLSKRLLLLPSNFSAKRNEIKLIG